MSQVILFDLDGTLTESGEGITKSVQYALNKMGRPEENLENLCCFVGPPLAEQFMKYAKLTKEEADQAVTYYRERYTEVGIFENALYPHVKELLELLKINDKILGVASSKPEKFVRQILEYFQIDSYFTVIVGSEMNGERTKKAEVIEEALQRLNCTSDRDKTLMVGDRAEDVVGARACGLQCIGVAYGYGSVEELENAGAVYIAHTVDDLGILASPNDEETTEHVESISKKRRLLGIRKKMEKEAAAKQQKKETAELAQKELQKSLQENLRAYMQEKSNGAEAGMTDIGSSDIVLSESEGTDTSTGSADVSPSAADPLEVLNDGNEVSKGSVGTKPLRAIYQIWRVIYPILIHFGFQVLLSIGATIYFTVSRYQNGGDADTEAILSQVTRSSIPQLLISALLTALIVFFLYRADERKRKTGSIGKGSDFVWAPPVIWFSVVVFAVAGSQLLNDLISLSRLNEVFPQYDNMAEQIYTGQPIWMIILAIGIAAPLAEELVFRGLVFRRMLDWMKPGLAIFFSALIFGLYHGNVTQAIYAFLLGGLFTVIYYRTGTLWTTILAHVTANIWSLVGIGVWDHIKLRLPGGTVLGIVIEVLFCVIPAYWIFGGKRNKINE